MLTTWRKLITAEMERHGDAWAHVAECVCEEADALDIEWEQQYGGWPAPSFRVWTHRRVYFPSEYDGLLSVESVARHPDGNPGHYV